MYRSVGILMPLDWYDIDFDGNDVNEMDYFINDVVVGLASHGGGKGIELIYFDKFCDGLDYFFTVAEKIQGGCRCDFEEGNDQMYVC